MAKKKKNSSRYQIFAPSTKRIIFVVLATLILLVPIVVFAQTRSVRTKVGNPKLGDTLKIGYDIKHAYDVCNGGYTWDPGGIGACLRTELEKLGYDENALNLFDKVRPKTLWPQEPPNETRPCTQCLGYVRLVLALLSGNPDVLGYGAAGEVAGLSSFSAGPYTWTRLPDTGGTVPDLKPGDIGAHAKGGYGHIFIVVNAWGAKLQLLESNGLGKCQITDNLPRAWTQAQQLVFFRINDVAL